MPYHLVRDGNVPRGGVLQPTGKDARGAGRLGTRLTTDPVQLINQGTEGFELGLGEGRGLLTQSAPFEANRPHLL
eukprot:7981137-Pyramimonas_sp.AAC.1